MPHKLTWLQSISMAGNGSVWLGGREGVFYSEDSGQNWTELSTLPISDISGLSYDSGSETRRRHLMGFQLGAGRGSRGPDLEVLRSWLEGTACALHGRAPGGRDLL